MASLMIQGCGSDVGKSTLVAGLCRLFANRGLVVRPFKPQNMSNNAAVTEDGGEIGRAQALQALACRTPSTVHMNPVLLKPQSDIGAQVVVRGKVVGNYKARAFQGLKPDLLATTVESYRLLAAEADLVLVEGAGSPAETNLRAGDIANMGFAHAAVGDRLPVIRKLEPGLWEVRSTTRQGIARVLFTVEERTMVLIHGFTKKSQKTPVNELNTARGRLADLRKE